MHSSMPIAAACLLCLCLPSARAAAQTCARDGDCQPGQICHDGACLQVAQGPRGQAPGPAPSSATVPEPSSAWPIGASVMAFVGSGLVLGLGVAAGLNNGPGDLDIALGASAVVSLAVLGPVSSLGQSSARAGTPISGCLGARIPAWILYGITLIEGVTMVGLGAANLHIPSELIYATTVSGASSLILFGIDDLVSLSQAQAWREEQRRGRAVGALDDHQPEAEPMGVRLAPVMTPILGLDGRSAVGASLGLAGRF